MEKEKMLGGDWYDANNDSELITLREKAQDLCYALNNLKPSDKEARDNIQSELFGLENKTLTIISPFMCDYGKNITFGDNVFLNFNCYLMDGGKITIGNNVFIGPNCGFYTADHPRDFKNRNLGLEKALPITIQDNVWIGGNVVILPGVTVGSGSVIGAGSVVTKNIEKNSIAVGNPCKVIGNVDNY